MSQEPMYVVRDSGGATYGPANLATLRDWIGEGRITGQMQVSVQGSELFTAASEMPELAGALSSAESVARRAPAGGQTMATSRQTSIATPLAGTGYPGGAVMMNPRSSGLAVTSLVCGIACWVMFCFPVGIVAIITGHMARGAVRREPDRYEGQGMATAGMVLGYIQLLLSLIVVLGYILIIVLAVGAAAAGSR